MLNLNINSINFCANKNSSTKVGTKSKNKGNTFEDENLDIFMLSPKSKKLIIAMNHEIENSWREIKKGNSINSKPRFALTDNDKYVEVTPIYGSNRNLLSIEITNKKFTEKILIDRKNPNNFRYEKIVVTDFGYATLKSFNSEVQHNKEMTNYVNTQIENYFPKILSKNLLQEYFGRQSLTRRKGIDINI